MSPLSETMLLSLTGVAALVTAVWIASVVKRDASIIDPFWGAGFVLVAWLAVWHNQPAAPRALLIAAMATIWGLRLSLYLLWRNWGHGEDRRYQAMRARQGERFWWVSLLTVFWLQAGILWFVSLPLQVTAVAEESPWNVLDILGGACWFLGISFESVGDWQLARFKHNPGNAGRVMDRGLWRWTRHPNYFGDCCVWWGLFLVSAAGGGLWTIGSPLVMTLFLLKVSGVALLEKSIGDRRPEYAEYQARTNAFFPGPRKDAPSRQPTG